jgi:hypothetical protein
MGKINDGLRAYRATHKVSSLDTKGVEHPPQVVMVGEGRYGRYLRRHAAATASHVIADHPVLFGERPELPVPHPAIGDPSVDQDERLAVSQDFVVERGAVCLHEPTLRLSVHLRSSHAKKYARSITSEL